MNKGHLVAQAFRKAIAAVPPFIIPSRDRSRKSQIENPAGRIQPPFLQIQLKIQRIFTPESVCCGIFLQAP
ncbi:MAG: hypothetical protein EA366_02220 [Spirulina sp. DLM2.Bin59]|nr:MAG: hypothetical protein EA366_02220 [Spirulina sp. DLM2.Bin59]